jgi:hypothetical protein
MTILPRNRHKMHDWPSLKPAVLTILVSGLGGCAHAGAPSFEFFGAFFPAWMLCALAGIAGAAGARAALASPRVIGALPSPLAVCTAIGIAVALIAWLLLFR